MAPSAPITPNIWFDGNAEQAVDFYVELFGGDSAVLNATRYPDTGLPNFQRHLAGQPLTIDFLVRGRKFTAINAGAEFKPNPAISFMVNFDPLNYASAAEAREELDVIWQGLSDGGQIMMPLQGYEFSDHYGWVQDRYGVSWQLILTDPEGDPRPMVIPAVMFGGAHQNQAAAAVDYWAGLFPNSSVATQFRYPEPTGPATKESLMFSDFTLDGQWFVATDSAVEQNFTFTEAVSLLVQCEDQAEIDRYWAALSAVPEAEQCGWCRDRFGVSWQIVPKRIDELMQRPGAYERLLQMKKLVIGDF